ncbi:hypothetical protein GOBAR_AA38314 [Gossypium barbadense]|uniref:Uncharacterized protein n=1 Tax=Gossypium barbadense TaxID=3634 RepID=A0A2P5VU98_GOSBA|nr:hypothetical protein GOBAR_AA38314 [Gossypium barbadense]
MAKQEAEHNVLSLEARVTNSLRYYSAIFDSIDYSFRCIVRFERNGSFEKWRKLMEQGGFKCMGINETGDFYRVKCC